MLGNTVRLRFVYVPIKEKRKTFRFTGFWLKGSECSAPEKKKKISPQLKAALILPNKFSK